MKAHDREYPLYIRGEFFGGVEDIKEGASRRLLPLERFKHERLRRKRPGLGERAANANAAIRMGKSCAGLAQEYRTKAEELRTALAGGRLGTRERVCFSWVLAGMRPYEIHELYNQWGLSIYTLARTIALSYRGHHALARWLNLWGEDPEWPLPEYDGLTRAQRAKNRRDREVATWLDALRTPGARKTRRCLEEAADLGSPHPRRSVLGHACAALGCPRGATTHTVEGRPVTCFGGPELDEASQRLPRSLAQGLDIAEDGAFTQALNYQSLKEKHGITIRLRSGECMPRDRVLWSLEKVNDDTDATPAQMAQLIETTIAENRLARATR